ncbi:MAG: P-loop NTPase [Candidatus Krumholzibacteria bacterium]|nr:P-loop NTPase [Candidatus Krumholzibacteria bacterium]
MSKPDEDGKLRSRLELIGHKVLVLSGKGGVGKSTVAVNLAVALAAAGKKVGLLDIDLHGPSVPKMLGIEGMPLHGGEKSIRPFVVGDNLLVMSIGFLLRGSDEAVIWRGPLKMGVIKQFLADVEWGPLDYLVVDSPPGTGDEPLSIAQLIPDADGAVIVTTPQDVALLDVRRCITFCRQLNLPVLGVVENMSGFACPHCGKPVDLFGSGGGEKMAADMGVPFIGRIPFDPRIVTTADDGRPFIIAHQSTDAGRMLAEMAAPILALPGRTPGAGKAPEKTGCGPFRIAIPVDKGAISAHFGHAERFLIFDVDAGSCKVAGSAELDPPEHGVGVLPEWLKAEGVTLAIAGGIGRQARDLLSKSGIEVVSGVTITDPAEAVRAWLDGELAGTDTECNHDHGKGCGHGGGCGKAE